jgi:hypothetical protein
MVVGVVALMAWAAARGPGQTILPPDRVPVAGAIAAGERAARHGKDLSRWRFIQAAPPDRPTVREVVVATPYFRVAREAYQRALRQDRLTVREAEALLQRLVDEGGPFPLGLILSIAPPPHVLPNPRAIRVTDARGRPVPLRGVLRPGGEGAEVLELLLDGSGADLRRLEVVVPLAPPQRISLDLVGVK